MQRLYDADGGTALPRRVGRGVGGDVAVQRLYDDEGGDLRGGVWSAI